jgi:(2R)-3-sulfolactate dehydrogenase (NADP+)
LTYQSEEIFTLCIAAARKFGASPEAAASLAAATVHAQEAGKEALGLAHFFDYLDAMQGQRLDGGAQPTVDRSAGAVLVADGAGGLPHVAFDRVFQELSTTARQFGVAVFSQRNSYTCGALGYFAERLAAEGLVCIAATNSSAHMAAGGSKGAVFGTNPLSFAVPRGEGKRPFVFDQASSQTALVNVRKAARDHAAIPDGWAVDASGRPTSDAAAALLGALLPFGGYKGANIATMVELLSTMSGASWSVDAGFFDSGARSPSVGMFVLALNPAAFDPDYITRVEAQLDRLRSDYAMTLPGDSREEHAPGTCEVTPEVFARLREEAL